MSEDTTQAEGAPQSDWPQIDWPPANLSDAELRHLRCVAEAQAFVRQMREEERAELRDKIAQEVLSARYRDATQVEAIDADDEAAEAERDRQSSRPHADTLTANSGTVPQPPAADLPREVGTEEAARILGVSKDTVLKYRENGVLPARNLAPPGGARPVFRYPLSVVVALRTQYETSEPSALAPREPPRRAAKDRTKYKHLDLGDD